MSRSGRHAVLVANEAISVGYRGLPSHLISTEKLTHFQALGSRQTDFVNIVVFLVLSWIDEKYHQTFLRQHTQILFPVILSNKEYWSALSTLPLFDDKTSDEVIYQMRALLSGLLWASAGTAMPQSMKPCRKFSPLQNICLYLEAFRVPDDSLGALQPLNEVRLALIGDKLAIQPQVVESWDSYLRTILPIDCVRNDMASRLGFCGE